MAKYEWKENPACVATYNILEGDKFLDQFEDADVKFEDAGELKIGNLLFYPGTTSNGNILDLVSLNIAQKFLSLLVKTYTVKKENPAKQTAKTIQSLAEIFRDKSKTLADLAEVVDADVKFPNE